MENNIVCVTGGSSYLGSWLVKRLLNKGYTVHATLRNLGDPHKAGLLKGLLNAQSKLKLFEADVYSPNEFESAIRGCKFVVHMATPLRHEPKETTDQNLDSSKNTWEAAVAGIKIIVDACIRSGTVKRLIYTASVVAASPLQVNGNGFKSMMDESCWTPLDLSFTGALNSAYIHSKTLSEKEVLSHNGEAGLEVVSIACGLVGGDTILSTMPDSMRVLISQITNDSKTYCILRNLEELLGKVPIVHIEDVCEAHILCMEKSSISGRFLCASEYLSLAEIASHWRRQYPEISNPEEFVEDLGTEIAWGSAKLKDIGFQYKFDAKMILDESEKCAKKLGEFGAPKQDLTHVFH